MTTLPPEYLTTVFLLENHPPPFPRTFAIITAWNPKHRSVTDAENRNEDEALRRNLELRDLSYFRATGCSPDLSHREPGWAVEMPKADAITLGKRFGQRAIWWVAGDELLLVNCDTAEEADVGSFSLRIVGA
jgi:hypothetical protein